MDLKKLDTAEKSHYGIHHFLNTALKRLKLK